MIFNFQNKFCFFEERSLDIKEREFPQGFVSAPPPALRLVAIMVSTSHCVEKIAQSLFLYRVCLDVSSEVLSKQLVFK